MIIIAREYKLSRQ